MRGLSKLACDLCILRHCDRSVYRLLNYPLRLLCTYMRTVGCFDRRVLKLYFSNCVYEDCRVLRLEGNMNRKNALCLT